MWVQSLGRKDTLEEEMQGAPVFLPGESQGQRQATVCGITESQTRLSTHILYTYNSYTPQNNFIR